MLRQTGSHIRLATSLQGEHRITVPAHPVLKVGTLSGIIAMHLKKDKGEFIKELFGANGQQF